MTQYQCQLIIGVHLFPHPVKNTPGVGHAALKVYDHDPTSLSCARFECYPCL